MPDRQLQTPTAAHALASFVMSLAICTTVIACLFWYTESPGIRSLTYSLQLALGTWAGPLYVFTAKLESQTMRRYAIVGPMVGFTTAGLWILAIATIKILRRITLPPHLILTIGWMLIGTLLLLKLGGK